MMSSQWISLCRIRSPIVVTLKRKFFFRNLFNHFQYARTAKKKMAEKGLDLQNLTEEQKLKLKPIYRLQSAFRVVNVVMGSMGLIAFLVWYSKKKSEEDKSELIEKTFHPVWVNLKHFKHRGALIDHYLIPEQVVEKLNDLKSFEFQSNDLICASFPKSGTTLLQELIYLIENDFNYDLAKKKDLSERFAFLEWPTTQLKKISSSSSHSDKRFFKTHLPPRFFNQSFQKAKVTHSFIQLFLFFIDRFKVIYIYRNPKDVTVSFFHFLRSINIELTYSGPWDQFVHSFLLDEGLANFLKVH